MQKISISYFMHTKNNRQCIVVNRNDNGRVQFLTVPGMLNWANPVVIAENKALGVEGCWIELISSIKGGIKQKTYYEDGLKEWMGKVLGFEITYYDGVVFIIESC